MTIPMLNSTGKKCDSSAASLFIETIFIQFDEDDILYCVERNYQGYPNHLTGDVDIVVADGQMKKAVQIIDEISKKLGWSCYVKYVWEKTAHIGFCIPVYPNRFVLVIELFSGARWHGIVYLSASKLLSHRIRHNITWKPLPAHQAIITSIHHLLYNGHVPSKYRQEILSLVKVDPELFCRTLSQPFGKYLANLTLENILNENWDVLAQKSSIYKFFLILRNFQTSANSIPTILRGFVAKHNMPDGVALFVYSDNIKQRDKICAFLLNIADLWHIFIPPFRRVINCDNSSISKSNGIRFCYRAFRNGGVAIFGCDLSSEIALKFSYPHYKIRCVGYECIVSVECKNSTLSLAHFVISDNNLINLAFELWNCILANKSH